MKGYKMAKSPKIYKIERRKSGYNGTRTYHQVGTLEQLIEAYSYTLEKGASWQHEKGNKKINRNPKSIKTLVSNLYNAENNAAANGYSGNWFSEVEVTTEDRVQWEKENTVVA